MADLADEARRSEPPPRALKPKHERLQRICICSGYAVDLRCARNANAVCMQPNHMRCTCSGPFSRSMTDRARTNSTSPWRAASACVALGSCSARPRSTNRATIVRGRSGSHVALSKARLRRVSSRPVWVLLAGGSSLEWHTARRSAAGAEARARARRGRQGSHQRLLAARWRWSSRLGKSPSVPGSSARPSGNKTEKFERGKRTEYNPPCGRHLRFRDTRSRWPLCYAQVGRG